MLKHIVGRITRRSPMRRRRLSIVAVSALGLLSTGAIAVSLAQPAHSQQDQQLQCIQLEQELSSIKSGSDSHRSQLPALDRQIANMQRIYRGTKASMDDAGCFQSFFIFGRSVVRSPRCLNMNSRLENARRQLRQLQDRRDAIASGQGDQEQIADIQDALARNGCTGAAQRQNSGLFNWFGNNNSENAGGPGNEQNLPITRTILPNVPYRTVCVRLCDGFYYPINYSVDSSHFAHDANQCRSTCAAPAQLYVYQNPGQKIQQAISLNGQPYIDLPVAFEYRKKYIPGCSCEQAQYNPTEIEAANAEKKGKTGSATPVSNTAQSGPKPDNSSQWNTPVHTSKPAAKTSSATTKKAASNSQASTQDKSHLSPAAQDANAILHGKPVPDQSTVKKSN